MRRAVHLVGVGQPGGRGLPPLEWLDRCALELARLLGISCRVRTDFVDASPAYDPHRQQYNSSALLALLAQLDAPAVVGVTQFDLFVPILTFVFGEAQLSGRAAVVSAHRLEETFYGLPGNTRVLQDRLLKEVLHEWGHTQGLRHCDDWECVMSSSHAVARIDSKQAAFCPACAALLEGG